MLPSGPVALISTRRSRMPLTTARAASPSGPPSAGRTKSTPAYRPVLDLHGWGDLGQDLTRLSKEDRWAEMPELIDDEVLNAFAIVAPLEQVPDRLVKRGAGVVDRVSFISSVENTSLVDMVG